MSKKITLELSEELIADLGYAKQYAVALEKLLKDYPHTIQGDQQRIYVKNISELLQKASKGIGFALKNK